MRNVLLLAIFLNFVNSNAQRTEEIYNTIQQMDSLSAFEFADKIASSASTDYTYMYAEESDDDFRIFYSRTDLTTDEFNKQRELGCYKCFIIYFKINADNSFRFTEVFGNYEDLIPTWLREFQVGEFDKGRFGYQYLKDRSLKLDVRLNRSQGIWNIKNWTLPMQ